MNLKEIQYWFGKTISVPLTKDHSLPANPLSAHYIAPSLTLNSHQRIEIYYKQYWWRLLKSLETNFPTVTRLFGHQIFHEKLAAPYLSENPPSHWALCSLGERFPHWIEKNYFENDRYLVHHAALIDWAAQKAFWIGTLPKVDFSELSGDEILKHPLILQPHVSLFSLQGDLFSFRDAFLKQEPNYFNNHPFPKMEYGDFNFILYRSPRNKVLWKKISKYEFELLNLFKTPLTIEKACSRLEENEEIYENISLWFHQWTVLELFGELSFTKSSK